MVVNNLDINDQNKTKTVMVGSASHIMVVYSYYPLREVRLEREALAPIDKVIAVDVICQRDDWDKVSDKVKDSQVFGLPVNKNAKNMGRSCNCWNTSYPPLHFLWHGNISKNNTMLSSITICQTTQIENLIPIHFGGRINENINC